MRQKHHDIMSTLIILIIVITVAAAIMGYRTGFVKQLGSFAGLLAGIICCRLFADKVAGLLGSPGDGAGDTVLHTVLAYAIVFITAYVAVWLLAGTMRRIVKGLHLGVIDRIAGSMFKVIKWLFATSIALNLWVAVFPDSSLTTKKAEPWGSRILNFAPVILGSETVHEIYGAIDRTISATDDAENNKAR